jgi:predicted MFS family arabinose efflux permease
VSQAVPLGALVLGHVLSQWLRTMPAITASGVIAELGFTEQGFAIATGLMAAAFMVGQIPVGIMLDRIGPRRTSLTLLCIAAAGSAAAAAAPGRVSFAAAQVIIGAGCAGLMMAPLSFAARTLRPERFGAVSGYLPGIGGIGLLLSGSPSALLIGAGGWRLAYAGAGAFALVVVAAVARLVPDLPRSGRPEARIGAEVAEVARLLAGQRLRAPVVLALVGYAALIGLRGLWAGPYLTDQLGLTLAGAGDVLAGLSLVLIVGPVVFGWLDRHLADRAVVMGVIHLAAALPLGLLAAGGAGRVADIGAMAAVCFALTSHVLLYPMTRALCTEAMFGKALAAVNLSFFLGITILQPLSGIAAAQAGIGGALAVYAIALAAGALAFLAMVRRSPLPASRGREP